MHHNGNAEVCMTMLQWLCACRGYNFCVHCDTTAKVRTVVLQRKAEEEKAAGQDGQRAQTAGEGSERFSQSE